MHIDKIARLLTAMTLAGSFATADLAHAAPAAKLKVTEYGKTGGWTLRRMTTPNGKVKSCDAFIFTGSETGLRFEYNWDTSAISFNGYASAADEKPMKVAIWFDNDRSQPQTEMMPLEADAAGYEWRTHRSTNMELDVLSDPFSNAKRIHFTYKVKGEGMHDETFLLTGTNPAVKKTIDCVQKAPAPKQSGKP